MEQDIVSHPLGTKGARVEHAQLTNKATHKNKTRVFRLGSYTEHLQSRPEGKVNSSIYYKIPGNTRDCKVDEKCTE